MLLGFGHESRCSLGRIGALLAAASSRSYFIIMAYHSRSYHRVLREEYHSGKYNASNRDEIPRIGMFSTEALTNFVITWVKCANDLQMLQLCVEAYLELRQALFLYLVVKSKIR